ncbi:glycosyltransferase family 39 protein [Solirubrobacter phytolaccae]|uniref:Glycosyltransferase family 39 protein n=1 Tax=Solirubrobacter phytolaccae TaxID=1404360 RepID=A0A9X3NBK4_9ACTN|nr:glycosyltransferase family 39 protein [Solirubrobacter phytolaccae]MDA0182926.1 glycosyltransferase family 39 protein [Solirubrobacter phytolaccae]
MSTVIDRPAASAPPRPARSSQPPPSAPAWARPGFYAVLLLAAVLVGWGLTRSGMSNTYYAAAVKSATVSWKAWFFGAIDPGSFITVDKPPLSIWLMGLSGRIFGFSSFSMLLPQALCAVASVGVLHATVKRLAGPGPALLAAGALAISPVSIAIGRVNNPDALLVLLLVLSAYLVVRAVQSGRTLTLMGAGAVVGLAFMTKMLQGWMVVPALGAVYLLAGQPRLAVRIRQLLLAGVAMVVVSAAWPLAVTLWPGSAPYIGGSTDGSAWDLIFGYNGFGRLFGQGGGGGGASFGGAAGWLRMFNSQVGGQIAWLLPLAVVSLGGGLWLSRGKPRTDGRRALFVLFGVWALVHFVIFSRQEGTFHPYYVSALAPAVAVLAGVGLPMLAGWARRSWPGAVALAVGLTLSAWVAVAVLARSPDFAPWLRTAIPVATAIALYGVAALRVPALLPRRALAVTAVAAIIAVGAGPASYAVVTSGQALNGNNVTASPTTTSGGPGGGGFGGGGMGGGQQSTSTALTDYLVANQGSAKYLVAVSGSQTAAPIILATGKAVVTMGGFSGSDNAPTLEQLQAMVSGGELQYVLVSEGGGGRGGPGGGGSSEITEWVTAHGTAVTDIDTSNGTLYKVTI